MIINKNTQRWASIQNSFFYVIFLAVILILGYLSQIYVVSYDWTAGNRNTLTKATQQQLQKLNDDLLFKVFIPEDEVALISRIKKRIDKYKQFKKNTFVEFINPDLQPVLTRSEGIKYAGQIAVHLGEKTEVINSMNEHKIVNVLQRLARKNPRLVVFLEGHNEREFDQKKSAGMSQLASALATKGFYFQAHHLIRTQSIPDNTRFLVIASPQKALSDGEVVVVVDYIKKGGNLLWLHEPGDSMNLEPLADELGILIQEGTLVDANKELRQMLGIQHPAVIPVVDYGGAKLAESIKGQTIFPFATAILRDPESTNEWSYESLLSTLPSSWLETGEVAGNVRFNSADGDIKGPLTLGLSLARTIAGKNDKADIDQRVIVVGDSDFMLNAFVGHADNLILSTAIYNWLANDDDLVSINVAGAPDIKLMLSPVLLYGFGLFFLIILPLLLLLCGFFVWWKRGKS